MSLRAMETGKRLRGMAWPDFTADQGGNRCPERVAEAESGKAGRADTQPAPEGMEAVSRAFQPLWGDLVSSCFLHDLGPVPSTLHTSFPPAF